MFPKEIIEILEKYQSDNTEILDDINLSISTIKCILQEIDETISKEGSSSSVEESKILQEFIESIQFVGDWKSTFDD